MPHAVLTRRLGRSQSWRKATVQSLARALLKHERIETTLARAKEAQRLAERLITLGKSGSLPARRRAIALLNDPDLVGRLFSDLAPRFQTRSGGYTRILHRGFRSGDGASMALLELVERPPPKGHAAVRQPQAPAPEGAKTPEGAKAPKAEKPAPEKPKGFLQGLRKFFKDRSDR
ncbi:MAG: 50S ribosomal protein L17 [Candidatus Omnitrophica bacterium]|nr:50S ribosomal protein L17 [Candidatus Omnitrophota bacterium]